MACSIFFPIGRAAHVERHGALADHERHFAVRLDVDLLQGRARGERRMRVFCSQIERAADDRDGAVAIGGEHVDREAGDDVEIRRIAGLEPLEELAVARRQVGVGARDHERGGLVLGHA